VHDVAYVEGGRRNSVDASRRREVPWRRWRRSVMGEMPSSEEGVCCGGRGVEVWKEELQFSSGAGRMACMDLSTAYLGVREGGEEEAA